MTLQKSAIRVVPGLMAVGIASKATKLLPKVKKGKIKPVKMKKFIKTTGEVLVGTALIKPVSNLAASI